MSNLFQRGTFTLHSGLQSSWKIDCDALADEDIATLAEQISKIFQFGEVYGIPRGGERIAAALRQYSLPNRQVLIVDDVLTTGASMEKARLSYQGAAGLVIFARSTPPYWVTPIFRCYI